MRREAKFGQRREVLRRAVPLVAGPGVARVARGEPLHQRVAHRLGDDRCGGDAMAVGIAVHDRFVRAGELGDREAVHEDEIGSAREAEQGAPHRKDRGAPDVEAIDLVHARGAHGDGECPGPHHAGQLGPLNRGQQLRVTEAANRFAERRKHDGRGHHRTRQWTAACLVETGDESAPPPLAPRHPKHAFALERGAGPSHAGGCSVSGTTTPRFSRIRAALPARRRRKYSLARRTRPLRTSSISAIAGECSGKIRSTPTPAEILRTVNVSLMPPPRRPMHTPSNACRRSLSPSRTRTITRTVSPGSNAGMLVFNPSRSIALSRSIPCPYASWCFAQRSGRRARVSRSASAARHAAIRSWSPLNNTSGTGIPRYSGGR